MLFRNSTVQSLVSLAHNANYNPNEARTPSSHGGEIGGSLARKIIEILNLTTNNTFGELGFGRDLFLIEVQLLHQNNTCFGVENDETRFNLSSVRMEKILGHIADKCTWRAGNPTVIPHFILGDFSNCQFWDTHGGEYFRRHGLKLFLNNYNYHMLFAGVQSSLENYLTEYCPQQTVIVSLAKMFLDRRSKIIWETMDVFPHKQNYADLSWSHGSKNGVIMIYVYSKKA